MEDELKKEKQPLTWPTLNFNVGEEEEIIEHIHLKVDESSIDQILFEIELTHPHIAKSLGLLIGHKEFEMEMHKLIVSEREDRQGFKKSIMNLLLKLSNLHYDKYGMLTEHKYDVWNLNRL